MNKYFVSYTYLDNNIPFFGNTDVSFCGIISKIEDVRKIEEAIQDTHSKNKVVVLNWRRFE